MTALMKILKFLAGILAPIVGAVTAGLLAELKVLIKKFQEKCEATENPYDDMLAEVLCILFNVE